METKLYETRHVYLVIGLLTAIFAPIFMLFVPQTVAEIIHYKKGVWDVLIPDENFIAFVAGFILIFLACMILFILDIQKYSIILSVIFFSLSLGCFFIASQSHVTLSDETINYSPFYSIKDYSYTWDDVEIIMVIDYKTEEKLEYRFIFKDGNQLLIENNDKFRALRGKFTGKIREMNIEMEVIEK